MKQTIQEKIKQRRRQMLVHSYLYYERDVNIIDDSTWSKWAMELAQLQKQYPQESRQTEFYELFIDWDGSTGAYLRYTPTVIEIAEYLYSKYEKRELGGDIKVITPSIKSPVKQSTKPKRHTKSLF